MMSGLGSCSFLKHWCLISLFERILNDSDSEMLQTASKTAAKTKKVHHTTTHKRVLTLAWFVATIKHRKRNAAKIQL